MNEVTALWTFDEALKMSIQLTGRTPGQFKRINEYVDDVYKNFHMVVEYLEVSHGIIIDIPSDWDNQLEQTAHDAYRDELLARAEPFDFHGFNR